MPSSDFRKLHTRFVKKHREKTKKLQGEHPTAWEFLTKTEVPLDQLGQQTARFAAAGALTAALTFTPLPLPSPQTHDKLSQSTNNQLVLSTKVSPQTTTQVSPTPEFQLDQFAKLGSGEISDQLLNNAANFLSQKFGLNAVTIIDNIKLPVYFGWIGAEQHLQRFPGDVASLHDEFMSSGIAPKVGAWDYFAQSPSRLTDDLKLKEKYYVAIQTFNLPSWEKDWPKLKEWFKYRKVIVVNPEDERAVVAVVADAGPAEWTGKDMGGSPEVMDRLGLTYGFRKGRVLMFFVDDPGDEIPLGETKIMH